MYIVNLLPVPGVPAGREHRARTAPAAQLRCAPPA